MPLVGSKCARPRGMLDKKTDYLYLLLNKKVAIYKSQMVTLIYQALFL